MISQFLQNFKRNLFWAIKLGKLPYSPKAIFGGLGYENLHMDNLQTDHVSFHAILILLTRIVSASPQLNRDRRVFAR